MIVNSCARVECGAAFETKDKRKKFCSSSCSAKVSNSNRQSTSKKPLIKCGGCQAETRNPKYCSQQCGYDHRNRERALLIEDWKLGVISAGEVLHYSYKLVLYKDAGYKCTECGWDEVNEKYERPVLCVDHIDGDWRNNFVSNLRVLCYNCHTLTSTFGALNRTIQFDELLREPDLTLVST